MSAYRFLIGPVDFLGARIFEVRALDDDGEAVIGAGTDPAAATADLDSEIRRRGGDPDGPWQASKTLAEALSLPASRIGTPHGPQRDAVLRAVLSAVETGRFWTMRTVLPVSGLVEGFAQLARRAGAVPLRRSFPYRATIRGTWDADLFAVVSRETAVLSLVCVTEEEDVRRVYDAAMGGGVDPASVDLVWARLDLSPSWVSAAIGELYGVPFAPFVFQRVGGERKPVSDATVLLLSVMAGACPDDPLGGERGECVLGVCEEMVHCVLEPIRP